MSTFRHKPSKTKPTPNTITLDSMHRKKMSEFKNDDDSLLDMKNNLKNKQDELSRLNNQDKSTYTINDIKRRATLRDEIDELKDNIENIENKEEQMEYFGQTWDLLVEYYELLDDTDSKSLDSMEKRHYINRLRNSAKITGTKKKMRSSVKERNLIDYLFDTNQDIQPNIESERPIKETKASLLDKYLSITDVNHVSSTNPNYIPVKECHECKIEKQLIQSEGIYVCTKCGEFDRIVIGSERANFKEQGQEKQGYAYKPINHFKEF